MPSERVDGKYLDVKIPQERSTLLFRREGSDLTSELIAHVLELTHDVLGDVTGLQVIGQDIPRIGFNLEMRRQGCRRMHGERCVDAGPRGLDRSGEVVAQASRRVGRRAGGLRWAKKNAAR